ncbi:MAG: preprotein translocase subunit SecG [Candidatus Omnitrophica bacterium]|nr:preprotein translocase subunit SecG [Candidatus Omnitrophota bacterium]
MYTLLLIVHVMVSLFLIFIILIQSGKGEGLSDVFGGGSSQTTIFGTRTGTFLTKATTVSAVVFMLTCLSLAFMSREQGKSIMQQELIKKQAVEKVQDLLKVTPKAAEPSAKPAAATQTATASSTAPAAAVQPDAPVLPNASAQNTQPPATQPEPVQQ